MQKSTTAGEQPHSVAHQAGAARLSAPSALRNRAPITEVLAAHLPTSPLRLLEIASGTGQHALYAARALPHATWQPSDIDPTRIASVNAWRSDGPDTLLPAIELDASAPDWATPMQTAMALCSLSTRTRLPFSNSCLQSSSMHSVWGVIG